MADMMILWDKATDAGTWSGGNWRATLPLAHLALDDIAVPARSVTVDPADTWCRVVLDRTMFIGGFALLRHNLSVGGRVRFAVSVNETATAAGPFVADSGWMDARPPDVPFGAQPWGVMPWTGHSPGLTLQPGLCLWVPDGGAMGRVMWMWIDDPHNPDGFVEAGRMIAGPVFRPQQNMNYGVSIDPGSSIRSGQNRRTRGGRKLRSHSPLVRGIDITLEQVGSGAGLGALLDLAALGPDHSLVFAYDAEDAAHLAPHRTFYGSLADAARIVTTAPDIYSCSLKIEEEL